MALIVLLCVECHSKAVNCFVQREEYNKIVPYASSFGLKIKYPSSRVSETSASMKNCMAPPRFYVWVSTITQS